MTTSPPDAPTAGVYRSYLVRFWQSTAQGSWRASAQSVQSGATVLFGDVASLLAFLATELAGCHTPAEPDSATAPADPAQHTTQEPRARPDRPAGASAAHTARTDTREPPADPPDDRGVS